MDVFDRLLSASRCCFLATYPRREEVELHSRETWTMPNAIPHATCLYLKRPICFAREVAFEREIQVVVGDNDDPEPHQVLPIVSKERVCSSFDKWQHGHTPREHQEMLLNAKMLDSQEKRLQEQRDWQQKQDDERRKTDSAAQAKREQEQRDWQQEQETERRTWQRDSDLRRDKEQRDWQDSWNRWNRYWQVALALVAGIIGAVANSFLNKPTPQAQSQPPVVNNFIVDRDALPKKEKPAGNGAKQPTKTESGK